MIIDIKPYDGGMSNDPVVKRLSKRLRNLLFLHMMTTILTTWLLILWILFTLPVFIYTFFFFAERPPMSYLYLILSGKFDKYVLLLFSQQIVCFWLFLILDFCLQYRLSDLFNMTMISASLDYTLLTPLIGAYVHGIRFFTYTISKNKSYNL